MFLYSIQELWEKAYHYRWVIRLTHEVVEYGPELESVKNLGIHNYWSGIGIHSRGSLWNIALFFFYWYKFNRISVTHLAAGCYWGQVGSNTTRIQIQGRKRDNSLHLSQPQGVGSKMTGVLCLPSLYRVPFAIHSNLNHADKWTFRNLVPRWLSWDSVYQQSVWP